MRKLLLIGLVVLGVSCQKDYYLQDLETANARIERLQDQLNDISLELQQSIEDNRVKAEELVALETQILDLNSDIEQLISLNLYKDAQIEGLLEKIDILSIEIESLNSQIADLQNQLADALEQTELDVELITDLNNQITDLDNREPEIVEVIKEVEVIVHSVQYVTQYVDVELAPNVVAIGLPDVLANGAATFNRGDISIEIGDTILAVDYITGVEQFVDVKVVVQTDTLTTIIFETDINVTSQIVLFKVTY